MGDRMRFPQQLSNFDFGLKRQLITLDRNSVHKLWTGFVNTSSGKIRAVFNTSRMEDDRGHFEIRVIDRKRSDVQLNYMLSGRPLDDIRRLEV